MSNSFEQLSKIDVTKHVEKKGQFTYLSWPFAVSEISKVDPSVSWEFPDPVTYPDGTMMVFCNVTACGKTMRGFLPVMDNRNKAISNPNAFDINKAYQRCLVKAIALHGLGLYIYAGEDLPDVEPAKSPVKAALASVQVSPEDEAYLKELAAEIVELVENQGKPIEGFDLLDGAHLDNDQKLFLWDVLKPNSKTRTAIKREGDARKAAALLADSPIPQGGTA